MNIMNMDVEIISVDLKISLLEMKGKVAFPCLNSPNHHLQFYFLAGDRLSEMQRRT